MSIEITPPPIVIYGNDVDRALQVDRSVVGVELLLDNVTPETVDTTTIYLDGTNRLVTHGVTYTRSQARLRYADHPELRHAPGIVVSISTRLRGHDRSLDEMNKTLAHELVHVRQIDSHDIGRLVGRTAIKAGAFLGLAIGYKRGSTPATKVGLGILGAGLAEEFAYWLLSPHEQQARLVARTRPSRAISRSSIKGFED